MKIAFPYTIRINGKRIPANQLIEITPENLHLLDMPDHYEEGEEPRNPFPNDLMGDVFKYVDGVPKKIERKGRM